MDISLLPFTVRRTPADVFIGGVFEKGKVPKDFESLEPAFCREVQQAWPQKRFEGKFSQILASYGSGNREAKEVILLGLGERGKYTRVCLRKAVGEIMKLLKERHAVHARILTESFVGGEVHLEEAVHILTEISFLASYDFDKYKSRKDNGPDRSKEKRIELLLKEKRAEARLGKTLERARAIAQGTLQARNLINEPGNVMNAQELARRARQLAGEKKISCKILDETEIKRLKMGGILAVNQGSTTPPALIILEYGTRYKSRGSVCLVGKGVTFDTGGISIKPSKDMEKMKYDMAGAAAVIAILGVVADLRLPVHVVGVVPAVENNVANNPQRPGDIIRMYNGKTVEVLNTDAEGRLILGDALAYTAKYRPKAIIDLATLTGMCAYTFADKAIGALSNNDRLFEKVQKAGEVTGERCWRLPLWDEYGDMIKGHHSDLQNIGGPYGGTITAAMFLKEFVPEKTPWVHLDIAGTAWCDSPRYDCPKGATGVGVRLMAQFLSEWR